MGLSFYKADLRYIKPSFALIILNNLVGILDIIGESDLYERKSQGLRTMYNLVVYNFVSYYCV